ncbi:N-acetyldiaminopimelate deacetylase [Ureibacillus acetophenoni]
MIAGTDALLSGISTEVMKTIDPAITVSPLDNWFFMSASTFLLAFLGAFITDKIVEPRLGTYTGDKKADLHDLSPLENRALRNTGIAALLYIAAIVVLLVIPNSPLLNDDGTILRSPFLSGIVPLLFGFFLTTGITYGVTVKEIKKAADVPQIMAEAIKDLSGYIVLIFIIGQFIGYFNWTNIATWMAVNLAALLHAINLTNIFAIVLFILLVAILSLFIISGSALWSLVAPIFVPTFYLLDYHPALVQLAYRVGESSTNMVTPLNPYFAIILGFVLLYNKKAGIGTLMSLMIPYTIVFLIAWILLMLVFVFFNNAGVDGFLATSKYDVTIKGVAAHSGIFAEKGKNALLASAQAALALHSLPPHSEGMFRVNVGTLEAGSGRNIIPSLAKMQFEIRAENTDINAFYETKVEQIFKGIEAMYDVEVELNKVGYAINVPSDLQLAKVIKEVAKSQSSINEVIEYRDFKSGSEMQHLS